MDHLGRFLISSLIGFVTLQTTFPDPSPDLINCTDFWQLLSLVVSCISGLASVLVGFYMKDWLEARRLRRQFERNALTKH